jgi:hypothetical protein
MLKDYKKSDAYRIGFELAVETGKAVKDKCSERDDDPLGAMNYCALRAVGKIAFGVGSRNKRMYRYSIHQCMSWLIEYGCNLDVAREQKLLDAATCDRLESLRGRGYFYACKIIEDEIKAGNGEPFDY